MHTHAHTYICQSMWSTLLMTSPHSFDPAGRVALVSLWFCSRSIVDPNGGIDTIKRMLWYTLTPLKLNVTKQQSTHMPDAKQTSSNIMPTNQSQQLSCTHMLALVSPHLALLRLHVLVALACWNMHLELGPFCKFGPS